MGIKLYDLKTKRYVKFPVTETVNFSDAVWKFDEFIRFSGEDWAYFYDFSEVDPLYRDYFKYTILRELFSKQNRFTSVKAKYYVIHNFIIFLTECKVYYPNLIDTHLLKKFLADTKIERTLGDKKQAIKNFLFEIELRVSGVDFSENYSYLNSHNRKKVKIEREKGKHKFVPIDIYNKIISLAIQDLRNEELSISLRAAACMIVLCAETGMRIGEFRILEVNKLDEVRVNGENEIFHYLNFKTYKTVKEKDFKWTRSFITQNAYLAYNTLDNLLKHRRKSPYLFVGESGNELTKSMLRYRLIQFFYRHENELQLSQLVDKEAEYFSVTRKRNYKSLHFVPDYEMDREIYYVSFHQYRVVLATILYKKGYHLDFIREHMNHLTEEMTQHYIRLEEIGNFEINAVETLQKRASQDGASLITDITDTSNKFVKEEIQSDEYQEAYTQINKFLKKNKLNVFNDIKEIVTILSKTHNPIAEMELGICAKSFQKLCKRNEYISSINDAYYLGIQIHSINELPYSIKRFQEKTSIIEYNENLYNKNPKYRNEYERELKGLNKYMERKLIPELTLLNNELSETGVEELCCKYPELIEIIRDLSEIEKDVQKWNEKTSLLLQKNG